MKDKKKLVISIFCVLSVLLIAIGVTYSIFTYTKKGSTQNTITAGKLTFLYTENTGTGTGINITDAFPVSDELGKAYSSDDQVFDFKVESEIVGDMSIPYEVTVGKTSTSTLGEEYIKLYLTDTTENTEVDLLEPTLYSKLPESAIEEDEKQIYFDEVEANEDYLKKFRLRMWIDESSNQEEINDKTFTVKVNVYSNEEVVKKEANTKLYTIVNDANSNGTADIGDEIALGDEHFYVISNDGTNINALAKYNLLVGNEVKCGMMGCSPSPLVNPTGIQDSTTIPVSAERYGTTAFSSDSQKGTNYSDYQGSIVEGYVNDYVTYLNTNNTGLNATGRLILKEELDALVNDGTSLSGGSIKDKADAKGYSWIYSTTYWSGSAYNSVIVWYVLSDGGFGNIDCTVDGSFGVRPVITIAA